MYVINVIINLIVVIWYLALKTWLWLEGDLSDFKQDMKLSFIIEKN